VSTAAFRGTALFLWTRNRPVVVFTGLAYALFLIVSEIPAFEQSRQSLPVVFSLLMPVVLPLLLFIGPGMNANADLTSPVGLFPRHFFVLPAAAHHLVLPFMLYAALAQVVLWTLAALITHGRPLDFTIARLWLPFLATSFVAWMQALLWASVRHRFVRAMQLLAFLALYIFALVESMDGALSSELTIALSIAQLPIAFAVAVKGVARSRCGEPSPTVTANRSRPVSTSATRGKRGVPEHAGALDAQLWMERQIHPRVGKSALVALIPAVLVIVLLLVMLLRGGENDASTLQGLGTAVILLLFGALGIIGISTGISFASFRASTPSHQAVAYPMPSFFAALPFATGDFAWVKMRAAMQRMLWVSAGVVTTCALVARISGLADAWMTRHATWRNEYGLAATLALGALPPISFVMLIVAATASVVWIGLLWRTRVVSIGLLSLIMLLSALPIAGRSTVASLLPVIIPVAAVVKLCALAALVFYVGSRRVLSWGRLGVITALWAATAGTLVTCLMWYAPEGALSPMNALSAGVAIAPVLGAVAAPAALGWNRVR
jgi:hypothetical protein